MDNITHTLIGIGLARAGLTQRFGRGTTVILAIASNLPDLDGVCLAFGPLGFLGRRTVTHVLPGGILLALVASVVFRRFYPQLSFRTVFGLTFLGIVAHVAADLWNSYGVVFYWPFSWQRVSLDWVFILDLVIWGLLIGTLALALALRRHTAWIWRVGLCLLAAYVGLCGFASRKSRALVLAQLPAESAAKTDIYVYPEPFGPAHFRVVARTKNDYALCEVIPFRKEIELLERLPIEERHPVVAAARQSLAGQRLDWFFSTAVWRLAPDRATAVVYGLGFRTKLFRPRA